LRKHLSNYASKQLSELTSPKGFAALLNGIRSHLSDISRATANKQSPSNQKRFTEWLGGKKRMSEWLGGKKRFAEWLGGKKRFAEWLGGKKRFAEWLGGKKRFAEWLGGKRSTRSVIPAEDLAVNY